MRLADQVELLRRNWHSIRSQRVTLPVFGEYDIEAAYRFKCLLLPARDIASTIYFANSKRKRLPKRLQDWDVVFRDEHRSIEKIHIRKLLGRIIHVDNLNLTDEHLDITNDYGKRVIVSRDLFLRTLERLVLSPFDTWLVICCLSESKINQRSRENQFPNLDDLQWCLWNICHYPDLMEVFWKEYFAHHSSLVSADCITVCDKPVVRGERINGSSLCWNISWRKSNRYACVRVEVSNLIHEIRSFFSRTWIARRR